jgi:hypothetical protein
MAQYYDIGVPDLPQGVWLGCSFPFLPLLINLCVFVGTHVPHTSLRSPDQRKVDAPQAAKAAPKPAPAPKAQASVSGDDDDDVPTLINDDEDPKTQAYKPQTKPAESSAPGVCYPRALQCIS